MDSRLGSIPHQAHRVWVAGKPVHDGPAGAAGRVDLQPQVVVGSGDGVVVLMDDEVGAARRAEVGLIQGAVRFDGEQWRTLELERVSGKKGAEMGGVIGYGFAPRLDSC